MRPLSKTINLAATALASVIALTACGGGSSTPATSGSPGASVSQGVVTGHGSVFVNGIEFNTVGADISIDGVTGKADADLKIGMVVKVNGTSDDATKLGKALKIEARDAVEGKIENVDLVNNTITVMGQVIQVEDNVTRLNDLDTVKVLSAAGFLIDDTVEVHGFADNTGKLRATRVFKKTTGEFETKGIVTTVGATSFTLSTPGRTGVLTVNFSAPLTAPAPNSMVEVKSAAVVPAGATSITASSIRLEDNLGAENEKVEVEGLISTFTSAQDFVVNGKQKVTTDASTVFEGGVKGDIAAGMKVEAEGPLKNGVIAATKISFRSNIRIEGVATNVTANGLTLLGKTITFSKFTTRKDAFIGNDQVEVRAMLDRDGNLVATRVINRGNVDGKAFLQGPVSVDAAGVVSILGTTIVTDASTQFRLSTDSTEVGITKDAFIAKAKIKATVVKVRWDNFTAVSVPVKEAEIELGKL